MQIHFSLKCHILSHHHISAVDGSLHSPPEQCLELIQTISTIPTAFPNSLNTCGRITVHNTGRFVLVSNRGHNSICVLSIEKYSGLLQVYFYNILLGPILCISIIEVLLMSILSVLYIFI